MKRTITCAGLIALMLGATSRPARDLPPTYTCGRANGPITIDGTLDDAAWADAPWTEAFIDIISATNPAPRMRTRAKLLWDDEHLYTAAELAEPRVAATIRQRDAQLFREQAFELFLDPGADGGDYLELQVNPLNTVCDLLMDKPYREKGKANVAFDLAGMRSAVRVNGTVNDPSDVDEGWTVELSIPWSALARLTDHAPPARGNAPWRLNLARMRSADEAQSRGRKVRREVSAWSSQGAVNLHAPERWGRLEFVVPDDDVHDDSNPGADPGPATNDQ